MVVARRGKTTIKVSRHTYEKMFRKKGFHIVSEDVNGQDIPEGDVEKVVDDLGQETEEEEAEKDIDSIPISEMNKQQLSEYAKKHNIDTSAATSVSQARKIIQREVRNRNM